MASIKTKSCPQCKNVDIPEQLERCMYCGYVFARAVPPVAANNQTEPQKTNNQNQTVNQSINNNLSQSDVIRKTSDNNQSVVSKLPDEDAFDRLQRSMNEMHAKKRRRVIPIVIIVVLLLLMCVSCNMCTSFMNHMDNSDMPDTNIDEGMIEDDADVSGENALNEDEESIPKEYFTDIDTTDICERCGKTYYTGREWPVESGYVPVEHCYELFIEDVTWSEAQTICESKGGHLITITCDEEFKRVQSWLYNVDALFIGDPEFQIWLGFYYGKDGAGNMNSTSVNGEVGAISNWAVYSNGLEEPSFDDANTGSEFAPFAMTYKPEYSMNANYGWVWNVLTDDISDYYSGKIAFICEWEHVLADEEMVMQELSYHEDFVFETSSNELLTYEDVCNLSQEEARIARNEIYARHGRIFNDVSLQQYFDNCSWYNGTVKAEDFDESWISEIEHANLDLIVEYETQMGWR